MNYQKRTDLEKLQKRIYREVERKGGKPFVFEEIKEIPGVNGFLGTDPIFFVGVCPSTGDFPSPYDRFLYSTLKKYGFRNAHITDLSKERSKTSVLQKDDRKQLVKKHRNYFVFECNILQPILFVTMGGEAKQFFNHLCPEYKNMNHPIWHYSWKQRGAEQRAEFVKGVAESARVYHRLLKEKM